MSGERQRAAMTWQPMSTAPRDGTVIFLYHKNRPEFSRFHISIAYWDAKHEAWWGRPARRAQDGAFTHWMPLPEPPQ